MNQEPAGRDTSRPDMRAPILGGVAFAVLSVLLGLIISDEGLVQAVTSGVIGGIAFAAVWFLIVRWRQRR